VDSAIVRIIPLATNEITVRDEKLFAAVVSAAFGQRRKTLRNTLRNYLNEADFTHLGLDAQLRAENLAVAEFTNVANYLAAKSAGG
jgi:16S rRNA (adenine1518-N6/adenine1519-N6)-dimethyltransferase